MKYNIFTNKNFMNKDSVKIKDYELLKENNLKLILENERKTVENKMLKNLIVKLKKEIQYVKKEHPKEKNTMRKNFINFQEFLAWSYIYPIINVPFFLEDKRVFAFMDHLSKYLRSNVSKINYNPLVSIIMPTYNRARIIQNAINSVLNQTYSNFELIIVDDGSTDDTFDLLTNFADNRIKYISNEENKGPSSARNQGLKCAKGDYIMYLDSDNEWDERFVETMIGAFIELPDADALYSGQLLYKNNDLKPYAVRFGAFNKPLLHNRNYIDLNCFCHKASVYNEIGGFDEDLNILVDWDLILRISNNFKIYSVPVLLSKYREYDSIWRITDSKCNYNDIVDIVLKKNKIICNNYPPLNKKVSIIIPSYEALDVLKECIEAIHYEDSYEKVEIIIVDNNSGTPVKDYLKTLESESKIKLILNDVNFGFTYAVNQGIKMSDENSDILILNNDAILTKGAVEHMQDCAYSHPEAGLIVPHEMLYEGNKLINIHVPYAKNNHKCDNIPSKEHQNIINIPLFHDGGLLELNFAPFFCTYIKRDIYNKTLGLDPELGRHYRSDRIYCDFIRHVLNLKIYQEPNAYVFHKKQTSTNQLKEKNEDYQTIFIKNQWEKDLAKKLGFKTPLWDY